MKRTFPHKVNTVPHCEGANNGMTEENKPSLPETNHNRKVRNSAAVIGLAISMGAYTLLMPTQGDGAMAAETKTADQKASNVSASQADIAATTPNNSEGNTVTSVAGLNSGGKANPEQLEKSNKGLERSDRVTATAINSDAQTKANTNGKNQTTAEIAPGKANQADQVSQLSSGQIKAATDNKNNNPELRVPNTEVDKVQLGESLPPTNVNALLKTKQDIGLEGLKQSSNRLKDSLAELRSEESVAVITPTENMKTSIKTNTGKIVPVATEKPTQAIGPVVIEPNSTVVPTASISRSEKLGTGLKSAQSGAPSVIEKVSNSTPTEIKTVQTGQEKAAETLTQPVVVEANAVIVPSLVTYQVNPGDTLDSIAKKYGISAQDLIQANQISEPNWLQVNQSLKIPQSQSVIGKQPQQVQPIVKITTGLNSTNTQIGSTVSNKLAQQSAVPEIAANNTSVKTVTTKIEAATNVPVVPTLMADNQLDKVAVPTVPSVLKVQTNSATSASGPAENRPIQLAITPSNQTEFNGQIASVPANSSVDSSSVSGLTGKETLKISQTDRKNSAGLKINSNQTQDRNGENNYTPYVENLRGEILKLRENYRAQKGGDRTIIEANGSQPVPQPQAPYLSQQSPQSRYINPEFNPQRHTEALQIEIQKLRAKKTTELPQNSSANLQPSSNQAANYQKPANGAVLATAPAGYDAYDPQSSLNRMVSPELPPLAPADTYLPKGQSPFNGYIWPAKGMLSSGYGWRWGRMHSGIDIAAPIGTPIVAAAPGVITYARWNDGGYGNLVEVTHADGSQTLYAHNNRILVREGQQVEQGQQISEMGSTGFSTGPHLHFEIHPAGQGAVNPMALLPQ